MNFATIAFVILALAGDAKDTTALVEAAKNAKAKRKTSTTKVITNADVKKAKGKLIVLPGNPEEPRPIDKVGPVAKHEAAKRAKAEAEARIAVAQQRVKDLERELAIIELAYYDEGDPQIRDTLIRRRFDATQLLLDVARKELDAAQTLSSAPAQTGASVPQTP